MSDKPNGRQTPVIKQIRDHLYLLSIALITLGVVLAVSLIAISINGVIERRNFERSLAMTPTTRIAAVTISTPEPSPTKLPSSTQTPMASPTPFNKSVKRMASPAITATAIPAPPTNTPTATPLPIRFMAHRIIAPTIKLNAPVVESQLKDGLWQVPKFAAGHLEGTAFPGEIGNIVLAGHVESISSGNVFERLDNLLVGNRITLLTDAGALEYEVQKKSVVRNNDLTVVAPTPKETLTLITCTGAWSPLTKDYDSRLIVVAERVSK